MEETLPEWISEEQVVGSMSGSLGLNRIWGLKRSDIMNSRRLQFKQGRLRTNITSGRMRERVISRSAVKGGKKGMLNFPTS
jgi:hypothetical protein